MDTVFLKLVNMSITASFLVLAILVLRLAMKDAPKWVLCSMWILVAVRLLLPFSFESVISAVPSTEILPEEVLYYEGERLHEPLMLDFVDNSAYPLQVERQSRMDNAEFQIRTMYAALLWLGGMVAMVLYAAVCCLKVWRRVIGAVQVKDNIYACDHIDTPFIFGLFRPKIYLPSGMEGKNVGYVVAHERAHIARRDHWWKPVAFALLTVYCFNPVLWIAYVVLCRDIELACDERVIRDMETDEKKAYAGALLECSISRHLIAACPLAFGEVGIKARVKAVADYRRPALWIIVVCTAICALVGLSFLSDPVEPEEIFLMGAEYRTKSAVYDPGTKPIYADGYCVTADGMLYQLRHESSGWEYIGELEAYELDTMDLAELTTSDMNWGYRYGIRRIVDSYICDTGDGFFYLVFRDIRDGVYLGYGWHGGTGVSEYDSGLAYICQLESDFEQGNIRSDFFDLSLEHGVGKTVDCFSFYESEQIEGYLIVGFRAGDDMADMGFAVFQNENGTGYRLLESHVYENAAVENGGIYFAEHPAVADMNGRARDDNSFDVILSCNPELYEVMRICSGEKGDKVIHAMVEPGWSMTLFCWEEQSGYDHVNQYYLNEDGQQVSEVQWVVTGQRDMTVLDLIDLSEKGKALTWEELGDFRYRDIGSGMYIHEFAIGTSFALRVGGGSTTGKPMYAHLVDLRSGYYIDIRNENVAVFLEEYRDKPVILNAIIQENLEGNPEDYYTCAGFAAVGKETEGDLETVYALTSFVQSDRDVPVWGEPGEYVGAAVMTFRAEPDGDYVLVGFRKPENGEAFLDWARKEFPAEVFYTLDENYNALVMQALQGCFPGTYYAETIMEPEEAVEYLLDTLAGNAQPEEDSDDVIRRNEEIYGDLLSLGKSALRYCFREFSKGGQEDLRGQIMGELCRDILVRYGEAALLDLIEPENGQEWFEEFRKNTERLRSNVGLERISEQFPYGSVLFEYSE